jgi:hypothetical protein
MTQKEMEQLIQKFIYMLQNKDQYPEMPAIVKLINLATVDNRSGRRPGPAGK